MITFASGTRSGKERSQRDFQCLWCCLSESREASCEGLMCASPLGPHPSCVVTHRFLPAPSPFLLREDRGHFSISGGQWESYGSFGNKASLLALCAVIILKNVKGVGAWSLPPVVTGSNLPSEQQHFCGFASPCWEPYLFLVHNIKSRGLVFLVQCFCMSAPECRFKFPQFITT